MASLDEATKEAYASAPKGQVIYKTVQITNTAVSEDLFFVDQRKDKNLPLEIGEDPTVFKASGLKITLPSTGENGTQNLRLDLQNVDRIVTEYLQKLEGRSETTTITFRMYINTDLSGPKVVIPLTLKSAKITVQSVSVLAAFADILNMPFPSEYYTIERFPSLGN